MKSEVFFLDTAPSLEEIFLSLNKGGKSSVKPKTRSIVFSTAKLRGSPKLIKSQPIQILVFYDEKLKNLLSSWKKSPQALFYELSSGEKTKSLEDLPAHITKINSLLSDFDKNRTLFLGVGGGSLLDLVGFLASIYKRGVPFALIPTTWLSAMDSAHGGKNAINFRAVKNLLGTYHFPQAVFIVKEILKLNPKSLEESAYGELLKISLIEGGGFYKKLKIINCLDFLNSHNKREEKSLSRALYPSKLSSSYKSEDQEKRNEILNSSTAPFSDSPKKEKPSLDLFPFLKPAIKAKMKIVKKDPFEQKSLREQLNFGHSIGHILEAHQSLSHGRAVLEGLLFSLNWSFQKGYINHTNFKEIQSLIPKSSKAKSIPKTLFLNYLRQDKKHKLNQTLDFVFIEKPGKVFIESVSEQAILKEAERQKLIRPSG